VGGEGQRKRQPTLPPPLSDEGRLAAYLYLYRSGKLKDRIEAVNLAHRAGLTRLDGAHTMAVKH